jgi:translocation and assembly module TamB
VGIVAALIVLVIIAVAVLLHSAKFHAYIQRVAEQKATVAVGANVTVQNYNLHFSGISPALDLYGLVVDGAQPYPTPPLLQIEHVYVAVRVTSLLRRTWYLRDVRVDHPVGYLFTDNQGRNNLPQRKSGQKSSTNVFDLGVRHAVLDHGEVYYNNRKTALDADLHDMSFQAAFNPTQRSYSGTLAYRNGRLKIGTYNPMEHDLDAQFIAAPDRFTLQRAVLHSGPSEVDLTASLSNYSQPDVQAQYKATIDAGQFRRIMKNAALPSGIIRAAGKVQYASEPNRPLLDTVTVNGNLSSSALQLTLPQFRGEIRDVAARYTIANGNADVRDLRARMLGGELNGTLTMRNVTGATRSHLMATLRGLSLAELKPLINSPAMQQVSLSGGVNADADATWGKTMKDLVARTDATINAQVAPTSGNAGTVPVNGELHARYLAAAEQISFSNSFLRMPQTSVTFDGTVSTLSSLAVRMQSSNLHELETVADVFRTPTPGQPVQSLGLYGTASFVGKVSGSTAAPQVTGQLQAANLRFKNSAWRLLSTSVNLNPSEISLRNGQLDAAQRGRITFNLSAGLSKWSFTRTSPIQASLRASQLNVADFARAAGVQTQVSGTLSADVDLRGSELNLVGQGNISLIRAKYASEPIQSLNVNFNGTGDAVHMTVALRIPAGTANAVGTYFPKQQTYQAQLQANGIQLARLQTVKDRKLPISGVLDIDANGSGTIQNPELNASLQVPRLDVRNQTVSGISLKAAIANHVGTFALDSSAMNTEVRGRGRINLTGEYDSDISLDTQVIPLGPLIDAYAPSQAGDINGQTELHATLSGPLKKKSQLEAHVVIPTLAVNYENTVQIGAANPIHLDYANGVLQLQRAELRGTGTDLQLQGAVPVSSTAPVSLLLLGTIDLRLAQLLNHDISSSGQLRFNINTYGQRSNPNVEGLVNIVNASFTTVDIPIGLQNGNGVLTITKDRLDITQFQGTVGGGELTATGGIVYRPALRFDVGLAGRGMRVLYNNIRASLNSNLALTGTRDAAQLTGQVRVTDVQFTPSFDLVNFMNQLGGGVSLAPPSGGFSQAIKLNVSVASTSEINLVSRTLSVQGTANLRVTGTAAQPIILGRVNLSGGDLIFNNNRYVLQGGTLDFINPSQTQPVVNVSASTTIQQYNIHIRLWGPSDNLHTSFASDPSLPPSDVINLLAGMQTAEAAQANTSPPGNLAAEQAIASQVSSEVTSRVEKIAGISQLSIDPVLRTSSGQNPGARITVQQRVTSKIFVTFQTDVTSTSPQNNVVQLQYNKSRRLSFSGSREQNGGFGFEVRIHRQW